MNLYATAVKNSAAHIFVHLFIHLFKKYLFNSCYRSGTKVNKTDETCHHRICSPFPPTPLSEFGNHRSNLDLATFYTLKYRAFPTWETSVLPMKYFLKQQQTILLCPVVFPDLQIANELSGYSFFCQMPSDLAETAVLEQELTRCYMPASWYSYLC